MPGLCVVAMGGNSLLDPSFPPTVENQFEATARAVRPIAELIERGERLVLTHGSGRQVEFMQLRSELASEYLHEVPLDSLGADSQGALGYMIQRTLREALLRRKVAREIATVVTEVEVDPTDPAFLDPVKPVGRFYTAEEAETFKRERGWQMIEDTGRGFRRVIPSPAPLRIVQLETIRTLAKAGMTVIACGGGGIPVMRHGDGGIRGLAAVLDNDRTTALLATQLEVKRLIITTGLDAIYRDCLDPERRVALSETTISELEALAAQGHFPPGSLEPKIQAAVYFLEHGGEEVIICKPEAAAKAFDGGAGTRILG